MTPDEFEVILENQLEKCRSMMVLKGGEYAGPVDRLLNFRVAAQVQGIRVPEAVAGMMSKHTFSVYHHVRNPKTPIELWEEKITDHINYLLLLKAALVEEMNGRDPSLFAP